MIWLAPIGSFRGFRSFLWLFGGGFSSRFFPPPGDCLPGVALNGRHHPCASPVLHLLSGFVHPPD
jgi:hypothetical protein